MELGVRNIMCHVWEQLAAKYRNYGLFMVKFTVSGIVYACFAYSKSYMINRFLAYTLFQSVSIYFNLFTFNMRKFSVNTRSKKWKEVISDR